jgi:hypothetical protein
MVSTTEALEGIPSTVVEKLSTQEERFAKTEAMLSTEVRLSKAEERPSNAVEVL